jgi:hypothetical protein
LAAAVHLVRDAIALNADPEGIAERPLHRRTTLNATRFLPRQVLFKRLICVLRPIMNLARDRRSNGGVKFRHSNFEDCLLPFACRQASYRSCKVTGQRVVRIHW